MARHLCTSSNEDSTTKIVLPSFEVCKIDDKSCTLWTPATNFTPWVESLCHLSVFFLLPPWFAMYVLCYKHSNIVQRNSQSSFLALRGPRQNSVNSCHILLVIIGKMKKMLHHLHTVVVADKPGNSRSAQLVCTVQKAHFFIWPSTSWQWKTTHLLRVFPTGEFACCPTECTMQIHCSNMKSIFMFTCAINVLACNEAVFN